MTINMPSFVCTALDRLNSLGYEAYIVGGCVRDAFLNKTPYDWDITTSAKPSEISDAFSDYKTIDTGIKHGTVAVIIEGEILEITTMRVDGEYSDNRHPDSVSFTENINLDLARRDFTVNAMAYSPLTGVVDPFGGQNDLNDKIIRCVGEPHKRFTEDALRILRGLRFSSTLQFEIESETANAMNELRELLDNVAAERKRVELLKLLCGADVKRILLNFPQVIFQIIPELSKMYGFLQNTEYHIFDVWEHTAVAVENAPSDPIYRVVMLFHDMGKPRAYYCDDDGTAHFKGHQSISYEMCLDVLHNLRFSKAETDEISKMVLYHDIRPQGREDTLLKAAKIGADLMKKLYPVFVADAKAHNPAIVADMLGRIEESEKFLNEAIENNECLSIKQLAVNGKDVAALGFKGKQIGEILNSLVNEVIKGNVENTKEKLVGYINNSGFALDNHSSKRKPNRLKNYDYSQNGAYFITICVQNRKLILSRISVGEGLAPPEIVLLPFGKIAQTQLLDLQNRYSNLSIDNYVIMPNHIHILMRFETTGGASPSPTTVSDIVCAFKSLTTRECKKISPVEKLFQRSFYDHIIRDEYDYQIKWQYIDENPAKWCEDSLYVENMNGVFDNPF